MDKQYEPIMNGKYHGNLLETSKAKILVNILRELSKQKVYYSHDIVEKKSQGIKVINKLLDNFIPAVINSCYEIYNGSSSETSSYIFAKLISQNFIDLCYARLKSMKKYDESLVLYELIFLVIDYISGMTDSYALKIAKLLS